MYLRLFYSQCAFFLAIGQNSRQHYLARGVPPERIGWSPYCIDTDMLERQVIEYLPQRTQLRREFGFDDKQIVFIFSGKLVDKKDPLTLASALESMSAAAREQIALLVLGEGALRPIFEARCRAVLGPRVVFAGFVNHTQIGRYYAAADCLVLPSGWGETWGLVVNEAMQFGLPAIVSNQVGCHRDFIIQGETGFVYPMGDARSLFVQMLKVEEMLKIDRAIVAAQCQQKVSRYSLTEAYQGIRSALDLI